MEISKELLEARERLLEAEFAAPHWNPPWKKPVEKRPKPEIETLPPTVYAINITAEAMFVEKLRQKWLAEKRKLVETVAYAAEHKVDPGNNHWVEEHHAELRFKIGVKLLEALGG